MSCSWYQRPNLFALFKKESLHQDKDPLSQKISEDPGLWSERDFLFPYSGLYYSKFLPSLSSGPFLSRLLNYSLLGSSPWKKYTYHTDDINHGHMTCQKDISGKNLCHLWSEAFKTIAWFSYLFVFQSAMRMACLTYRLFILSVFQSEED